MAGSRATIRRDGDTARFATALRGDAGQALNPSMSDGMQGITVSKVVRVLIHEKKIMCKLIVIPFLLFGHLKSGLN